jgi:DNA-binding GntR family transcriptional regulator
VTDLEIVLNRVSPVPLYHQLARQLVAAIEGGILPKGAFLDNELDLADRWQVSRPTVRRAIQDLVDAGMLVRRRGVGTQVVNDQVRRPFKLTSLFDDLAAIGREPVTAVLTVATVQADEDIAEALEVAVGTDVVHLERTRSVGGQPLAILRNWLVGDVAAAECGHGGCTRCCATAACARTLRCSASVPSPRHLSTPCCSACRSARHS